MTKATISIKRKNGLYCQLWYVNSDGYPSGLGKEIFENLKTVNDVERAVVIFKEKCDSFLETNFTLGELDSIEPILRQYNDYSYVLDEETGKWGFYEYKENKIYDLEVELNKEETEEECDDSGINNYKRNDYHNYEFERKNYPFVFKNMSINEIAISKASFDAGINEVARIFGYEVFFIKSGPSPKKEWYKLLKLS
jgi:hypothetical protein